MGSPQRKAKRGEMNKGKEGRNGTHDLPPPLN
jgi:hypothetical protein